MVYQCNWTLESTRREEWIATGKNILGPKCSVIVNWCRGEREQEVFVERGAGVVGIGKQNDIR